MKIATKYRFHTSDYAAWDDDIQETGRLIGFGSTIEQAVLNLWAKLDDKYFQLPFETKYMLLAKALCRMQGIDPDEIIDDRGDEAWMLVGYDTARKEWNDHG